MRQPALQVLTAVTPTGSPINSPVESTSVKTWTASFHLRELTFQDA